MGVLYLLRSRAAGLFALAPIDLGSFEQRLHHVRRVIDTLATRSSAPPSFIASARHELSALGAIRLPAGAVIHTDLPQWASGIDPHRSASVRAVVPDVDGLDDALLRLHPSLAPPSRLRELDRILAEPVFHPHLNPLQQLELWLGTQVQRFLSLLSRGVPSDISINPVIVGAIAIVFLLFVAGLAALSVRGLQRRNTQSLDLEQGPASAEASAEGAHARAEELAGRGAYREAFRYLFLATLLALQRDGIVRLQRGATNRELLKVVQTAQPLDPDRLAALAALTDEFDRVWYGHRPLGPVGYEQCVRWAEVATRGHGLQAA